MYAYCTSVVGLSDSTLTYVEIHTFSYIQCVCYGLKIFYILP